ncbi:ankyrin repeat and MYND domain-containing protein 2-like [Clavelina lepadiformis]|uniref:MYND-type domain-containing protein n=1 Tax=Clavelina lepadiformis TaxID=159417 RepID=A0ABP0FT88_CLALP
MEDLTKKLFDLVETGKVDEFRSLIKDNHDSQNLHNESGMNLLMQAAYKGHYEMCKYLLECGVEVNETIPDNQYTALMMAGLSGKKDVVSLLLTNGANVEKQNSIGKTAIELTSFVGQHDCANLMKNFLSLDKLEPYYTKQGDNEPRITKGVAASLQKILASTNPHPVKIVLSLMDSPELCNRINIKKTVSVLEDFCGKCVRSKNDYDEILALKVHYYSMILDLCREFLVRHEDKKLDPLVKQLLLADGDGFQVAVEKMIRKSILAFPHSELPLMEHYVRTIHPVTIGSNPTSFSCLLNMFNGMHSTAQRTNVCQACGSNDSPLRCGACKAVSYCSKRCQKMHWFVHKKFCKKS